MSTTDLKTLPGRDPSAEMKDNGLELAQWEGSPVTPVDAEVEPEKYRSRLRLIAVLAGLNLAMFTTALDQTIVATAVPTITSDLHSASGYVWIGGAYMLANAAGGPIWAKISDIWGRKPILLAAVALFFGSSILCAKAWNIKVLLVGRSLQGTAGGGMVQLVMITISDIFSIRHRSLYYGLLEVVWTVAGGVGPVLGGILTERLSWRFAFWINLPICGTTFFLLLFFLDVHNPKTAVIEGLKAVDWFGSLSILAVTLMVLLGLEFGGATYPWVSPQVLCLIIIGALISVVFIFSEKRLAKYPLMPLEIFKDMSNVASLLVCFMHAMCFFAGEYYLPLYFQSALEASPSKSGVLILPITITEAIVGILVGIFIHRTGRYLALIRIGAVGMVLGNGIYILFSETSSVGQIVGFQIINGIGQGLLFEAPLIAIQALVSQDNTATATSTFGFVRNLAMAMSVVICGVIFQNGMDLKAAQLGRPPVSLGRNVTDVLAGGHAAANVMIIGIVENEEQKLAIKQAFVWAMRNMWIFTTVAAAMAVVASIFIKKSTLSREHVETKTGLKEKVKEVVTVAT
ncbi:Efflux pump [Hyphodiscus hymeniophilus]|uniref:Efflux pump n=1 Tax=Hyphodiscus hymeniophilus TaxID=353542 RepID=A0A9P7AYR8_9HELO|nr:Efflux pump [Hyphodiscus hymeniophilus]